ncbi:hypothetical protein [Salinarimonas soli]|nr:hypothetical protein [Salinarimonas soli]
MRALPVSANDNRAGCLHELTWWHLALLAGFHAGAAVLLHALRG